MRKVLVALALAVVPIVMGVLPATSSAAISDCPYYHLCLFQNSGYTGTMWHYDTATYGFNNDNYVGNSANDNASSLVNYRNNVGDVYKQYPGDYALREFCQDGINPFKADNLTGWDYYWSEPGNEHWTTTPMNDNISSFSLNSTTC